MRFSKDAGNKIFCSFKNFFCFCRIKFFRNNLVCRRNFWFCKQKMYHFCSVRKVFKAFFYERHKLHKGRLYVCACHVHAFVNADWFSVISHCNSGIFRAYMRRREFFRNVYVKRGISCFCNERKDCIVKFFVAHHADILTVVPFKFFVVEYSRTFVQVFQLEIFCKFFKRVHVLTVNVGTAEHCNVIDYCLWKVAARAEFVYGSCTVTL